MQATWLNVSASARPLGLRLACQGTVRVSVLYTTGGQLNWPHYLDLQTGTLTYFGDTARQAGNCMTRPAAETSCSETSSLLLAVLSHRVPRWHIPWHGAGRIIDHPKPLFRPRSMARIPTRIVTYANEKH
ncbi:hypothetical protein GCM10023191_012680 [Actinoallomurus oryzae]|uniref:Uncharacterized protein n=1 Tax=Actinoallomurus oryzae TaxID=502180 RepID=A0ABP8PI00_9ACTN